MKHYLDLIPISAKVHKKQNKMSIFCIVLAVFLVTAIFGMADMFIRSQILQAQKEYGNWHIVIKDINEEDAALIKARPDIETISPYGVLNYRLELGYTLGGKGVAICGSEKAFATEIFTGVLTEGTFPQNTNEALVTDNAKEMMGLHIGDAISVQIPDEDPLTFTISGFCNTQDVMTGDYYGIILRMQDFRSIYSDVMKKDADDSEIVYYVRFASANNAQREIADLKAQFQLTDEQISENTMLLGLLGQSRNSFMMMVYQAAAILFFLVLFSGILMIASSLNSNVAQRTEFFGLIRCIGATPKQVMRLVHREALSWCRFAIPVGIVGGIFVIWILCAILRYLSPEYFSAMPVFGISIPSIIAGIVIGILTVLLAARAPAKRAAKVSPLAAVSGNANNLQPVRKAANTKFFKIDTALGIYHAKASRKNLILMTGSFALSIILFLSFSVTITFMRHAIVPMQPWTADLSIISADHTCSVNHSFLKALQENPVVDAAYGRMFAYKIPVTMNDTAQKIDLVSYEQKQFDWAEDYLLDGSLEQVQKEANTGLVVYRPQNTIQVGDTVTMDCNGTYKQIEIVGILSDCPFDSDEDTGIVICSEDTFREITGQTHYTIIDIQLTRKATDDDVNAIHQMVGSEFTFSDSRMKNRNVQGTYYSFGMLVYGFLVLIALITIFNVIHSIAMSVAARTKQYGTFRAIGLSTRQLSKMVLTEALTYAVIGSMIGTILGMASNKVLFGFLITYRWGDAWTVPWTELGIIILLMLLSIALAVYRPIKNIHNMSIVDTISAQ